MSVIFYLTLVAQIFVPALSPAPTSLQMWKFWKCCKFEKQMFSLEIMEGEGMEGDVQKKYPFREKFQYHCKHYFKHSFTVHSETEYFTWKTLLFFFSSPTFPYQTQGKKSPSNTNFFCMYFQDIFFPRLWNF